MVKTILLPGEGMKRYLFIALITLIAGGIPAVIGLLYENSIHRDMAAFQVAVDIEENASSEYEKPLAAYRHYLDIYPHGRFAHAAATKVTIEFPKRIDEREWKKYYQLNTEEAYRQYIADFPRGKYVAHIQHVEQDWQQCRRVDEPLSRIRLLVKYQQSPYHQQAIDIIVSRYVASFPAAPTRSTPPAAASRPIVCLLFGPTVPRSCEYEVIGGCLRGPLKWRKGNTGAYWRCYLTQSAADIKEHDVPLVVIVKDFNRRQIDHAQYSKTPHAFGFGLFSITRYSVSSTVIGINAARPAEWKTVTRVSRSGDPLPRTIQRYWSIGHEDNDPSADVIREISESVYALESP